MPCIQCANGAVICGPTAKNGDCGDFDGVFVADAGGPACPVNWKWVEKIEINQGSPISKWVAADGTDYTAFTPFRGWHEKKCK